MAIKASAPDESFDHGARRCADPLSDRACARSLGQWRACPGVGQERMLWTEGRPPSAPQSGEAQRGWRLRGGHLPRSHPGAQALPSQDGDYWLFFYNDYGFYGSVRCFFVPALF